MKGKIGIEEHFAIDKTLQDSSTRYLTDSIWPELQSRLLDIQQKRIDFMDEFGIEMMVLSLNAPAIQAISDTQRAIEMARRSNDFLAEEVAKRPDRFTALAALPIPAPFGFEGNLFAETISGSALAEFRSVVRSAYNDCFARDRESTLHVALEILDRDQGKAKPDLRR